MIRKFLFQLHLWSGLILGIVIVLIGLSGSISLLEPLLLGPPSVQVTAASTPALDKGLDAARAAAGAPQGGNATILLPRRSHEPVQIYFGGQMPTVVTDPGTGRVLATFSAKEPGWFDAIRRFHNGLLMPDVLAGRVVEAWLGLVMTFLGLTGLYLWWPKAAHWKYAFTVRRKAKGLRLYRELHGAAGIWTLAIYLLVTATGVNMGFPLASEAAIKFATGGETPNFGTTPAVTASAKAALIGPDAALAAASKASDLPVLELDMPDWKPGQPTLSPIIAQTGPNARVYLDPYRGTVIPNPDPPPNNALNIENAIIGLHSARDFGPVYKVLVFISGLMPLIFFVTGLMMWLKKRQNRLAMNQPLPTTIFASDSDWPK